MAADYPNLKYLIAEYEPERQAVHQIMLDLAGRGIGTFFWELTRHGVWDDLMYTIEGTTYHAKVSGLAEFDALRRTLGL